MSPGRSLPILGQEDLAPTPSDVLSPDPDADLFTVAFVTLGCAKNLVDSEKAMGGLAGQGFAVTTDPEQADAVVVNTCGFIESAKQESIDEILRMADLKRNGRPRTLVVAGCLSARYAEELAVELPEVDRFMGLVEPAEMLTVCRDLARAEGREPASCTVPEGAPEPRLLTTPSHYAFLKIAEGCSNPCTFCAIPIMRGLIRSFEPETLLAEARSLVEGGVRELIVVAQDTTHYGVDLTQYPHDERPRLADLIRRLGTEVDGLAWLRLMYAYPSHVTDDLLDALAETPTVVPYLDIPIQHGSERMLAAMRRTMDRGRLRDLLLRIRERLPDIALRTSIIVGFPGETEEDLEEMLDLLAEIRFERLGVFPYSPEEGTPAHGMDGRLDPEVVERRRAAVMALQQGIVAEQNAALQGRVVEVLVEEPLEDLAPFAWLGRTVWDAPEVDQGIYLEPPTEEAVVSAGFPERLRHLRPGDLVRAEIVGATDFDLEGVLVPEPPR